MDWSQYFDSDFDRFIQIMIEYFKVPNRRVGSKTLRVRVESRIYVKRALGYLEMVDYEMQKQMRLELRDIRDDNIKCLYLIAEGTISMAKDPFAYIYINHKSKEKDD